jgi:hypothetical protein
MLSVVIREVTHVGSFALYFLFCFGIFATLKRLFLATYQIEFSALMPTVIDARALAKGVVLLDMAPLATHLDTGHPTWWPRCTRRYSIAPSAPPCCSGSGCGIATETSGAGRSRLGGVEASRSKRPVGQSHHCRAQLCLLPTSTRESTAVLNKISSGA